MKYILLLLLMSSFSPLQASGIISNCQAAIGQEQVLHASLLANLQLQVTFKQGKMPAGLCTYKFISKRNELDTKSKQVKIKYQQTECKELSKSIRPRVELTLTYAPGRQTDALEIFALQDHHPLICQDASFDSKKFEKAISLLP